MVDFATFRDLERRRQSLNESVMLREASASKVGKTVFLAHSSRDAQYLPAIISILQNHGGSVYIDKDDQRLPDHPNRETAEILRSTIKSCPRFVVFVTINSKGSRWIPWELGLADGEKDIYQIALFPTTTDSTDQQWAQQEYLGLYRRIVWGRIRGKNKAEWIVHDHVENSATPLQ